MNAVPGRDAVARTDPAYHSDLTVGRGRCAARDPDPKDRALDRRLDAVGTQCVCAEAICTRVVAATIHAGDISAEEVPSACTVDERGVAVVLS